LMEADTARVTCYLETFNPDSIPFYNKMGFWTGHFAFWTSNQLAVLDYVT
jgi:hypothetical protein